MDGEYGVFSDEGNYASPEEQAELILRRHHPSLPARLKISRGFITYHRGDNDPFIKRLRELLYTSGNKEPRLPFRRWQQADPSLGISSAG